MRSRPLRVLRLLPASLALLGALHAAHAQPKQARADATVALDPRLDIEVATNLQQGPGQLEVVLTLGDSEVQPLLLTVASEGAAIQVVRGRFLRADGRAEQGTRGARLRFVVPVVVRAQGSAIVRADLLTYRCQTSCRALRASTRRTLEVGQPQASPAPSPAAPGPHAP